MYLNFTSHGGSGVVRELLKCVLLARQGNSQLPYMLIIRNVFVENIVEKAEEHDPLQHVCMSRPVKV